MNANIKRLQIPPSPGIYLMKDKDGKIIYIGKAKNLKNRVKSYFLKNQNYKTQKLVEKIADIEFVLTDNEAEAFLLESNMIKQYRPPFNIELKDQQRYTYLRLTNEKFPRLVVARRTRNGNFLGDGKIYGPFTSGSSKLLSIGTLRKAFKIRICKKLPKKACLEYHLGNCEAPCEFKEAQIRYANHVADLEAILKGRSLDDFTKKLQNEMRFASGQLQYERALEIKQTLQRLESLKTKQKMEDISGLDEEYFGIKTDDQTAHIMTFKKFKGVIHDSNRFTFDLIGDNSFANFLFQYYTTNKIPPFIVINQMPQNYKLLEKMFSNIAGYKVKFVLPTSGKRKEIIDLIMKNISLTVSSGVNPALIELQQALGLGRVPQVIECFDVSNFGTTFAVGAMSRFINGQPDKAGYRRFKIKTVTGQDDFAMISEIVKRRCLRLIMQKAQLPDLVLIDGGHGQLNAAVKAINSLGIKIPCVSLAKQNEEVFVPQKKESIKLPIHHSGLGILRHARDEAHRFGLEYNRALRMPKSEFT